MEGYPTRQTPDGANYPKNRPEGLYEGLPVGRNWELAIDSQNGGPGNYLVRSIYKVGEGDEDEFVENRRRGHCRWMRAQRKTPLNAMVCGTVRSTAAPPGVENH